MRRERWSLAEQVLAALLAGAALLLVEIRIEHREVLGETWHAWLPLGYLAVLVIAGGVALLRFRRGGRPVLMALFGLALVVGALGVWFHADGHPGRAVGRLAAAAGAGGVHRRRRPRAARMPAQVRRVYPLRIVRAPPDAPLRGTVAPGAALDAPRIAEPRSLSRREHVTAFTTAVGPHVRAAYGLARWLLGNDHDAEDAAQDAYVRAFRHFDGWNGVNARAWLLTIVRRCCYTLLSRTRPSELASFDEEEHTELAAVADDPERAALRADDARLINQAVVALPIEYREVFVLRELEGLSYREIADVAGVPIGTVMSRLSRARAQLVRALRPTGETP